MNSHKLSLATLLAVGLIGTVTSQASPGKTKPVIADLGPATTQGDTAITVTLPMKLRDQPQLNLLLKGIYTPGDPQYHHFISKEEFRSRFAPDESTVAALTRHYLAQGLTVTRSATSLLKLTGSVAAMQKAFGVQLHTYEVGATANTPAYRYHSPSGKPQIEPQISAAVHGVLGLDSRRRYRAPLRHATKTDATAQAAAVAPVTTNPFGSLTVTDFAQYYNVNPLYQKGISGSHRTLGILTLAAFTPSDAFKYWDSLGLKTDPARIKEVQVDGGSGPPSDFSGSDETTLDVEQAGGIAPAANVIVYEAPNTTQGLLDVFAAAVDDNVADTLSLSWGDWEFFESVEDPDPTDLVVDPTSGRSRPALDALNDVLVQAALQGQSAFTASGDCGAYMAIGVLEEVMSNALSVDYPASEQFITAVGGTTLPGNRLLENSIEAAWGLDYIFGFEFPAGSGGGVSSFVPRPLYQLGIPGMSNTAPSQAVTSFSFGPPQLIATLPANFAGRNIPDISLNSDPETGYEIFYTSDVKGFEVETFVGGTSFASPQFSAIAALFDQAVGRRVGLLNFGLYELARRHVAYDGPNPPFRDITTGDNWFYSAHAGYDQASGLGVPDVANLLQAFQQQLFY